MPQHLSSGSSGNSRDLKLSAAQCSQSSIASGNFPRRAAPSPDKTAALFLLQQSLGSPKNGKFFGYQEINTALRKIVQDGPQVAPDFVRVLLFDFDNDVNYVSRPTRTISGIQQGQRNNIVQLAISRKNLDVRVLGLLLRKADDYTLGEAFRVALCNGMDSRMELCLKQRPLCDRESLFRVSEALNEVVEGSSRPGFEQQSLMMAKFLLSQGGVDINFRGGEFMKLASRNARIDILQLLLTYSPSSSSLEQALEFAEGLAPSQPKLVVIQLLVKEKSRHSTRPGQGRAHPELVNSNSQSHTRSHEKSISRLPVELAGLDLLREVAAGTKSACNDLLAFLNGIQPRTSQPMIVAAVMEEILRICSENDNSNISDRAWLPSATLEVLGWSLSNGMHSLAIDAAFVRTISMASQSMAEHSHTDLAEIADLLATSVNPHTFELALNMSTLQSISEDSLWKVHSLIEWGAGGHCVYLAFCLALYQNRGAYLPLVDEFLIELLSAGMGVNGRNCLQVAADCGNVAIVRELLAATPEESMYAALSAAIRARHEETLLLALLDAIVGNCVTNPDTGKYPERGFPPIFECLQLYPNSPRLARRLLDLGSSISSQIWCVPLEDYKDREEHVTPLIWALYQVLLDIKGHVSAKVLEVLLEKCDVNFQTQNSGVTPLILAVKFGNYEMVTRILANKASTSPKDKYERSALFYASRNGNLKMVKTLLEAKAPPNDGSLHEAARELHADIVVALTTSKHNNKHDTRFKSTNKEHFFHEPLHEMLLGCDADEWPISKTEETLRALGMAGSLEVEDLFLALNNAKPIKLVTALMNCGLYQRFHDGFAVQGMLASNGIVYYFSPTIYIQYGLSYGSNQRLEEILSHLKYFGVQDCYYAQDLTDSPQPEQLLALTNLAGVDDYNAYLFAWMWQPANCNNIPEEIQRRQATRIEALATERQRQRNEMLQNQQRRWYEASGGGQKKIAKALEATFENEGNQLEARFNQENTRHKRLHEAALWGLQNRANEKRGVLSSRVRYPQDSRDSSTTVKFLVRQNWDIQRGDPIERRNRHITHLTARRLELVEGTLQKFSTKEKSIAEREML
ncbi:hypothetical protein B0J14DRAFT_635181 [Halenospora varia]|nr:hypothetical protein B0J14DRAFT_635181 [Halenospora varia]